MKIYHTHPATGAFTRESSARKDPLESNKQKKDVFMVPAGATNIKPPKTGNKEVAVFKNGNWSIIADNRGIRFHFSGGKEEFICREIGDLPEGAIVGDIVISDDDKWQAIRAQRDEKLAITDWIMLNGSPVADKKQNLFKIYRQELRDVPQGNNNPDDINWPNKP